MPPDKLAYMANQIARAFAHLPHDKQVAATAEHLRLFWDVRMRDQIVAQLTQPANKLDQVTQEAVEQLRMSAKVG